MHVVSVAPADGGWMVDADVLAAPLVFASGGRAEDAAKRLGEGLARAGKWAEIRVHVANGDLLGRFICPPTHGRGERKVPLGAARAAVRRAQHLRVGRAPRVGSVADHNEPIEA
jgi:hypothetical protein